MNISAKVAGTISFPVGLLLQVTQNRKKLVKLSVLEITEMATSPLVQESYYENN